MFVVKGLWSEDDSKVTYLYTRANEVMEALEDAISDSVYDISAITRVDYVRVFRADEDDVCLQWYNVTLRHTHLPEQDMTGQTTTKPTSKTRQALVQASDTIEAAAMVQGDEELIGDEVVKIACAKYDEVK